MGLPGIVLVLRHSRNVLSGNPIHINEKILCLYPEWKETYILLSAQIDTGFPLKGLRE